MSYLNNDVPTFKPVLHQIGLLLVAKSCCRKERVPIHFATKSTDVARLPAQDNQNVATPVYGMILVYLQQPLFIARQV